MSDVPTYYSNLNADLLAAIPPDSRRILEVGCGTGALASAFKRINPKCFYLGVESNDKAARTALRNEDLNRVYDDRIEDCDLFSLHMNSTKFDTIIFGDVLEHLVDPHSTLKRCVEWLEPNGSVVACVPNIQHWSVIYTLLDGQWPRDDSGIFDRTHLRWFTKQSLIEMFEEAGLTVAKIIPRNLVPGGDRLVDAVREFKLVGDIDQLREGLNAYQWIIHGVKGEIPSRKMLIRGFTAEACCARPRLTEPGSMLNTIPGVRYSEVPTKVEPGESVVVVRQRFKIDEPAVRQHLRDGCLIVGEWDDDPWHEGFAAKFKVPSVEWALKACHAIQVSTEAIADFVRPINPNVAVFPNQIAAVGPKREYVESDVVRVFMGGQRGREDWVDAVAEVNRIVASDPERYHFVVVHDRELFDAVESKHKTFYAFQPYEKYRELLRTCDVAISTLADTRFNRCKSDITQIECLAEGVMLLDGVSPRETAMIDLDKWLMNENGGYGYDWIAEDRMLCDHYRKRHEWYNGLIDDKSELDRQLFDRLPELRPTQ